MAESCAGRSGRPALLRALTGFALASAALVPGAAFAQATPQPPRPGVTDPSAITSGLIRRGAGLAPPQVGTEQAAPVVEAPAAPAATAAGRTRFLLQRVEFSASRFLSRAELDALAAPLLGREVGFGDLNALLAQVNSLYARRRIVTARAILPPQRIVDGLVRIDLVEGRIGAQNVSGSRYTPGPYVASRVESPAGETVAPGELQRRVSGFNRANDAQVKAELKPGARPGETDIDYIVSDPPRTGLQLFVDNTGYESAGRIEGGLAFRANQVLTAGDRLNVYATGFKGGATGVATYSLPITGLLRGAVSYSHSDVSVVDGQFAGLGVGGVSDSAVVSLTQPVLVGETYGVALQAVGTLLRSVSSVQDEATSDVLVRRASLGATGFAGLGKFGSIRGGIDVAGADLLFHAGAGAGRFTQATLSLDYSTVEVLGGLRLHVAAEGVYTDHRDLTGSQLFQIGGFTSVRGYEPGVAGGYAGQAVNTELHYAPARGGRRLFDGFVFFDHGEVHAAGSGETTARSVGVGLTLPLADSLTLQAVYARDLERLNSDRSRDRLEARIAVALW